VAENVLPAPGDPKVLYVVDAMGYVFRAFHALPPLTSPAGEPVGAVYGFTTMLQKLVKDMRPAYLAVAAEGRGPSRRSGEYAQYKANRPPAPEDLRRQVEPTLEVVRAYAIPVLAVDGYEADDVIATLVRMGRAAGLEVVIVSSDKDLMCLVGDGVSMLDTLKNKAYDAAAVEEKWGVPPKLVPEVLALMGDTSDNIPGLPGVGPKTATDLVKAYGTVEDVLAHAADVKKPKLRELLQTQAELARLSRRLVSLEEALELPFDLDHLRYGGWNEQALLVLFQRYGFRRLVDELMPKGGAGAGPAAHAAKAEPRAAAPAAEPSADAGPVETILVRKAAELATVVELCRAAGRFAIEPHPEGRAIVGADLVGVALSWAPGEAAYVPLVRGLFDGVGTPTAQAVREALGPLLADARAPKLVHDLTRTALLLGDWGLGPRSGVPFDTMLGSYLVDPERHAHRLEQIAATTLSTTLPNYDSAGTGERGKKLALNELGGDEAAPLAGARAAAIVRGASALAPQVEAAGLSGVLADVELPLAFVLADLERVGIAVDTAELARLSAEATVRLGTLEDEARRAAGVDFNLGSPKQLAEVLFEKLGLPVQRRTKTGYSTDSDVLEELEPMHPLPGLVLEHRAIAKLKGTYLDALPRMVHPRTGRLHTTYNQTGSATGRISSNDPNLQNIPVRTGLGQQIRRAFVPAKGHVLLSADYSQIELRVLAHLAEDPILLDAFAKDEDIHDRTAREVFGAAVGKGKVDGELRRRAKAINFGVIYGQTDFGLSKGLGIHKAEAAKFIAAYFERYAGIARFLERTVAEARERGHCETLLGRRRFLPDLRSANRNVRQAAERVARNTPIQGTAADILKVAMVRVQAALSAAHLESRMLLTVHDELVFEVPRGEEEEVAALAKKEMCGAVPLKVPLRVDVGWGESWAACKGSGKSPAA